MLSNINLHPYTKAKELRDGLEALVRQRGIDTALITSGGGMGGGCIASCPALKPLQFLQLLDARVMEKLVAIGGGGGASSTLAC